MSSASEDLEALQIELAALRQEREKESQKEKDVMRGLIAKIQKLTDENKLLKEQTHNQVDSTGPSPESFSDDYAHGDNVEEQMSHLRQQFESEKTDHQKTKLDSEAMKADLGSSLSKAQTQLLEIRNAMAKLQSDHDELAQESQSISQENRDLSKSLRDHEKQSKELDVQRLERIKELESETQALRLEHTELKERTDMDFNREKEAKEILDQTARINELSELVLEKDTEIQDLQKELDDLRKSQAESDERGKKYVAVLNKTKKQILKLEKEKIEVADELNLFKSELTEAKESLADALHKASENEEAIKSQSVRLHQQQSELSILQRERKEANESHMEIRDELQLKQAEYESSQSRVEDLEMRLKESERQLEEFHEKIAALEEQLSNSEQRRERLQQNEKIMEQRSSSQISSIQQKLESALNDARLEKENAERIKADIEKEKMENDNTVTRLKSELASVKSRAEENMKLISNRTDEWNDAQRQVLDLRASLSQADESSKKLSEKVEDLTRELVSEGNGEDDSPPNIN
jgi:chromosome segregation ATPase